MNTNDPSFAEEFQSFPENRESLLHTDLDLNLEEQKLLKKRIEISREKLTKLGENDPEFSLVRLEIESDLVLLDELKAKEEKILTQLKEST